jgi:hypothetical protein
MCEAGHCALTRHTQLVIESFDAIQWQHNGSRYLFQMEAADWTSESDVPVVDGHINRAKRRITAVFQRLLDLLGEITGLPMRDPRPGVRFRWLPVSRSEHCRRNKPTACICSPSPVSPWPKQLAWRTVF